MKPREIPWILKVRWLPGLYTRDDVKARLNLQDDDAVSKIVAAGLLRVLGKRSGKQQMYFWGQDIENRIQDRKWMERMVTVVQGPRIKKNEQDN